MRYAIITSIALLSSSASSALTGYVDKCYDGSTCCTNPSAARLFRRAACTPEKVCCQEKKIIKFETSTELRCGNSNVKSSTVQAKVSPCKDDASQNCLHVHYAPFADGTPYSEYHLQLSKDPIKDSAPGQFTYTNYCQFGTNKLSVDCYVPMSKLATSVYGNAATDFCSKPTLYIAAHGVEGKETCWAGNTPIGQNWAKYHSASFQECETICEKSCECPCPPAEVPAPPKQPEQPKYCEKGTGFGFNDACDKTGGDCAYQLNKLAGCSNRWGWWFELSKDTKTYDYELMAGAGGSDYRKGTKTGTVHVSVYGDVVDVSYSMDSKYAINTAHVEVSCSKPTKCAPGQFSHNSGCLNNASGYSKKDGFSTKDCTGGKVYLIFHADVTEKKDASDSCTPKTCS